MFRFAQVRLRWSEIRSAGHSAALVPRPEARASAGAFDPKALPRATRWWHLHPLQDER